MTVANNVLEGPHMGWGIAVSGVRGVVVTGNVDRASHIGQPWPMPNDWCDLSAGDPPLSAPSPPAAFAFDPNHTFGSILQPQFVPGQFDGLLSTCIPGDINNDGVVDQKDAALLQGTVNKDDPQTELCREDLDRDGDVDQHDVTLLQGLVSGRPSPASGAS